MKKIVKYVLILSFVFLFTGCNSSTSYLKTLTYAQFQEKINNKEDFVMIITKADCTYCQQFHPVFAAAVHEEKFTAYEIILSDLTEDEKKDFNSTYSVSGTPTVMFFKNGDETSVLNRMTGSNHSKDDVKNRIKELGYIK